MKENFNLIQWLCVPVHYNQILGNLNVQFSLAGQGFERTYRLPNIWLACTKPQSHWTRSMKKLHHSLFKSQLCLRINFSAQSLTSKFKTVLDAINFYLFFICKTLRHIV